MFAPLPPQLQILDLQPTRDLLRRQGRVLGRPTLRTQMVLPVERMPDLGALRLLVKRKLLDMQRRTLHATSLLTALRKQGFSDLAVDGPPISDAQGRVRVPEV